MNARDSAWRVAALFSSRRDDPSDGGRDAGVAASLGDGEGGTQLHYVHICTQGKFLFVSDFVR